MENQEVKEKKKKPFFKKVWFWIVVVVVVIAFASAGGSEDSSEGEKTVNESGSKGDVSAEGTEGDTAVEGTGVQEAESNSGNSNVTMETQVLADSNGIKVTATGIEDGFYGPEIKLQIENTSDVPVMVQSRDVSINGVMMSSVMFSCDVAAGKNANDSLSFMSNELKTAGIDTIGDIELKIAVSNGEDWSDIFTTETQIIKTSASGTFEQTYDDSGFVAVDQDGYRVIVKKLESEDSFWGADIYVYVENNSDRDVTIQARDVSINGYMVDPMFSSDVMAGKKAFDSISFLESDLETNGIEDITEMELYFTIFDKNSWDTVLDTDIIKVSFQ